MVSEGTRELGERENRGGGDVCSRYAVEGSAVVAAMQAAAATAVSTLSIGLSNAKQISPPKWAAMRCILPN